MEIIKHIPGTIGFKVSTKGIIYDNLGRERKQYTNLDGYKTASVKLLDGRWQTFGVHRLVALAHLITNENTDELTVNHIDSDIENNDLNNLEWVSVHINNIHAALMNKNIKHPKLLLTNRNGEKIFVKNIHEASDILKLDVETVWNIIKNKFSYNGNKIEIFKKIPIELRKKAIPVFDENGKIKKIELYLKDLDSGEITKFHSIKDLANKFSTSSSHVTQCISNINKISLFKGRYFISKSIEDIPNISPEKYSELKSLKGNQTYLFDKIKNKISIYDNTSLMIKDNNLSKKAVTTRLKNNRIGEIENFIFAYHDKQKEFLDRIKISRSSI